MFTDDETELRTYREVYSMTPDEAHKPSAAVAPVTVEEIQAVLRVARDYRISLAAMAGRQGRGVRRR